jgi:lipopolysaccharide transport system ATP-binding protein
MNKTDIVIDVRNVSKRYEIYNSPRDRLKQLILPNLHQKINRTGAALKITNRREPPRYFREFWALNDISFQVRKGEMVGIIGRNGSGKSTLLQILVGTLYQTLGNVSVNGRVAALLELGSGFNPHFSGRDNILLNGQILGLTKKEVEARYDQIVEFADIGEFIDQPVKTYSSGMYVRLAFAVQAHIDASIVIIDEALAVGDVFFRQKCYTRLEQIRNSGAAILLVSHSMPDIEQYCERAILLDHGVQKFIGPASEAAKHYYLLHQTQAQTPIVEKQATETAPRPLPDLNSPVIDRPPPEAFIDLSNKSQISNGQARCIGVALCNEAGQPCNSFRQGDVAVFYTEFELTEAIGVPICGLNISNERGVIVHGKNSWQSAVEVPRNLKANTKVICRQEVELQLGLGEYVFEIGLSSVASEDWDNRQKISHEQMSTIRTRICHMSNAGFFSVGMGTKNGILVLSHHGVANLPGKVIVNIFPEC